MKHFKHLFTALLLLCATVANAYDFEYNGAYYNITDYDKFTVEVTSGDNKYTGSVRIPEKFVYYGTTYRVTSIGDAAFRGCTSLASITIPNSVTSIGGQAFSDCTGLTSITIPNSVTSIGWSAFGDCSGLTSITIPNSVTSIGYDAFCGCTGLESIVVDPGNTKYDSRDNCNAIIETESNTLFAGCKNSVIPNSVTSIGFAAFRGCTGLTSITIPNSVTSIGDETFSGCTGLTSITIPNSVTSIEISAVSSCTELTSIVVAPGNTKYDSRDNCNAIIETESNTLIACCKNTVIPNSVTSIGNSAFSGCSGLTSITIPNSVTSIGEYAFIGCTGLTSITIPNSVTSIGGQAFSDCTGLTSITIPNSVTSIGYAAFYSCRGLTSVTIGNSVTSIGDLAFAWCYGLTDVYCLATDVPATNSNAFGDLYPENMTLHVLAEAINNYKTTEPWSNFGSIIGDVTPKCAAPVIEYCNGELIIECEIENAEFVTTITNDYTGNYNSNAIALTATYNISVYATATGYDNSDTVNATLCWIECDCDADDNTDIINIPAKAVLVTSNNGTINISCSLEGENVAVYTSNAMFIGSTTIENGCASIQSGLSKGNIAIIKIGEKSIKVILN